MPLSVETTQSLERVLALPRATPLKEEDERIRSFVSIFVSEPRRESSWDLMTDWNKIRRVFRPISRARIALAKANESTPQQIFDHYKGDRAFPQRISYLRQCFGKEETIGEWHPTPTFTEEERGIIDYLSTHLEGEQALQEKVDVYDTQFESISRGILSLIFSIFTCVVAVLIVALAFIAAVAALVISLAIIMGIIAAVSALAALIL